VLNAAQGSGNDMQTTANTRDAGALSGYMIITDGSHDVFSPVGQPNTVFEAASS
jgi:hypothetical protein